MHARLLALIATTVLGACSTDLPLTTADTIYFGGEILTVEGLTPEYVEAIGITDGIITQLGSALSIEKYRGENTQVIDLEGKTLLPGFFDSHSHLASVGMKLATVNLDSKPAGNVTSIDDIVSQLKTRLLNTPLQEGEWLLGMGYDNAMLAENRHPTKADLDRVSTEIPIIIIHFSMHMAVLNSKALEMENITVASPDPAGGVIVRMANSNEPNGIVEETAMRAPLLKILSGLGDGSRYGSKTFIERGLDIYAENGFTTVIEGGATPQQLMAFKQLASKQRLNQDVIALQFFETVGVDEVKKAYSNNYHNRFRVGGGKVVLDGGSPGRTAYLRDPYHTPTHGQAADYRGYPTIEEQSTLNTLVDSYYQNSVPIFIHALGDAAIDMSIDAVKYAEANISAPHDKRTQIIHAQQVQPDQFNVLKDLDITITFQMAHNFYFGDYHRGYIYGPERTDRLNPIKSAMDLGISSTIHHDAPVHPVDQMMLISSAVNRTSRRGIVGGKDEQITQYQAIQASTINAAYQFFEGDRKGSLKLGKIADLVILDENPLTSAREDIRDIKVVQTVKDGIVIWSRSDALE